MSAISTRPSRVDAFYEEGTGLPDRVLDVADEHGAADHAAVARALHPAYGGRRA